MQDLDEAQQQALLRVVAAANQNPGDDSEDDDEREVIVVVGNSLHTPSVCVCCLTIVTDLLLGTHTVCG